MRIAHIRKESNSVTSFTLVPIDEQPIPPPSRVNLLSCGCKWIRINRRFFAAIRCLICQRSITSASALKANRMGLEVRSCALRCGQAMCWMSARREEYLLCDRATILWFC